MGCDSGVSYHPSSPAQISIHASRMGCDKTVLGRRTVTPYFNPRIPYGMRRSRTWATASPTVDFNPRIPYGMRPVRLLPVQARQISIHASRMGCDRMRLDTMHDGRISIHASRMGCDRPVRRLGDLPDDFNPRIPYGMRHDSPRDGWFRPYFNPRIPYGMRHPAAHVTAVKPISIHASRMGCDQSSTWPWNRQRISIHASRMGCDSQIAQRVKMQKNFNPRIPYGMRRHTRCRAGCHADFNPRIPYGMRPAIGRHAPADRGISIHASRMGCDNGLIITSLPPITFQSTHPVWDATSLEALKAEHATGFQSTHPVWDATASSLRTFAICRISIHASRMGCDQSARWRWAHAEHFNPRIPYGMRLGA